MTAAPFRLNPVITTSRWETKLPLGWTTPYTWLSNDIASAVNAAPGPASGGAAPAGSQVNGSTLAIDGVPAQSAAVVTSEASQTCPLCIALIPSPPPNLRRCRVQRRGSLRNWDEGALCARGKSFQNVYREK